MSEVPDSAQDAPAVLITGATAGIGANAAERLADRGWNVLVHGRNRDRGETVVTTIRDAGNRAAFLQADFADPDGVRGLVDAVSERVDALDALVLNAALSRSECREGWDGVEETFAVNQLAPYRLAHDLIDHRRPDTPNRIVVTASAVHTRGDLPFVDDPSREDATPPTLDVTQLSCTADYEAIDAYARSKFANLCFAVELAARLDGVAVNAFHPGFVPGSGLYRDVGPLFRAFITLSDHLPFVGTSVAAGAAPIVHLVDDADPAITGTYFEGTDPADPDPRVADPDRRRALWDGCAELTGIDPDWP